MYQNYDVYKLAIKLLSEHLDSIIKCQKDIINFHQKKIDEIKDDAYLSSSEKNAKINDYMTSIAAIHELLKNSNIAINSISDSVALLDSNVDDIILAEKKVMSQKSTAERNKVISDKAKQLRQIVLAECSKIEQLAKESKELLSKYVMPNNLSLIHVDCYKLYNLVDELKDMFSHIDLDSDIRNSAIKNVLTPLMTEEITRLTFIRDEAEYIINLEQDNLLNASLLDYFCDKVRNEYNNIQNKLNYMDQMKRSVDNQEIYKMYRFYLGMVSDTILEEARRIMVPLTHLEKLVVTMDKNNKPKPAITPMKEENKTIVNQANTKTVVKNPETSNVLPKSKEQDTLEYKKCCTLINKSFWSARQKAIDENIKYPSALFEQKVKEYQNDYLISNYNISMEEIEDIINQYKEKYAEDIYVDELYERALYRLREETAASIEELCDESSGLSLLDQKYYMLLEEDLTQVEQDIRLVKEVETIDSSIAMGEYRKSYKINKLLERKHIIEHQIDIIKKRAKKIENETN